MDEYVPKIEALSAEDVQNYFAKYYSHDKIITVAYCRRLKNKMKKFIWLIAVLFLSAQHAFGGDMESFDLKNNIKVIFNKTSGVEVVSVRILTPVSVICENQDNAGISYLTAKMMTKSTKNRNSEQLARDIENIGASLIGDAEYDIAGISTNFLSEYFDSAMEILSDAVKIRLLMKMKYF